VKLDPFVFTASKLTEGEALATNEQRFAPNIKNVVSTDAFGDVPEGNIAEFMRFLPGVPSATRTRCRPRSRSAASAAP
jgi:hypothetical protein